jgi:membrane-associated phospholipid phosphatase
MTGLRPITSARGAAAVQVERHLFMRVNDGPDWRWLRIPQQLGTPWSLVGVSAILMTRGERSRAVAAALALPAIKGLEVAIKETLGRPRPLYRVPTELRDDAPVEGGSFPSGHVAIGCAAAWFLSLDAPRSLAAALWTASALNGYVRVHQGAHWPSDTAAGALLGITVAAGASAASKRWL